jgi:hypothetical protein
MSRDRLLQANQHMFVHRVVGMPAASRWPKVKRKWQQKQYIMEVM